MFCSLLLEYKTPSLAHFTSIHKDLFAILPFALEAENGGWEHDKMIKKEMIFLGERWRS
jgi:hypothetical protein